MSRLFAREVVIPFVVLALFLAGVAWHHTHYNQLGVHSLLGKTWSGYLTAIEHDPQPLGEYSTWVLDELARNRHDDFHRLLLTLFGSSEDQTWAFGLVCLQEYYVPDRLDRRTFDSANIALL